MRHEWVVRFDYGTVRPGCAARGRPAGSEVIAAVAGPDRLVLRGPRLPRADDGRHADEFEVAEGDELTFSPPGSRRTTRCRRPLDVDDRIDETHRRWTRLGRALRLRRARTARRRAPLPARAAALTHARTGGIVAAPTTQPARGVRRRAQLGLPLLLAARRLAHARGAAGAGYDRGGAAWRGWLLRAIAGDPEDLQIMYGVDGAARAARARCSTTCPATTARAPVRIGNGAVDQRQTDVLGEVMVALERGPRRRGSTRPRLVVAAARAGRGPGGALGRARQRALGDPRGPQRTSPTPG